MRRLWATILLASCAAAPPADPIRASDAPFASAAVFDPESLNGPWNTLALGSNRLIPACTPDIWQVAAEEIDLTCTNGARVPGRLSPTDTARYVLSLNDATTEAWVVWVAFDGSALILGDPAGQYLWVMGRPDVAAGDRRAAVDQILGFYGYDQAQITWVR